MRRILAVLLLAGSLLACGGDDALSKEEFIAQGDYIDRAIEIASTTRDDFDELSPPDDGEDVHAALVEALDAGIAGLEEAKTAAEERMDLGVIGGFTEAGDAVDAASDEAREYGFEVCSSESPPTTAAP